MACERKRSLRDWLETKAQQAGKVVATACDLKLVADAPGKAKVVSRVFRGAEYLYVLGLADNSQILALAPSHQEYAIGETVCFELDM